MLTVKLVASGEICTYNESYAIRMIEQGKAVPHSEPSPKADKTQKR